MNNNKITEICIDLDNCLYPFDGELSSKNIEYFDFNLKYLRNMCLKYDLKVHLTSSWGQLFVLKDNNIEYDIFDEDTNLELQLKNTLQDLYRNKLRTYLGDLFIGIDRDNNREKYFKKLLKENKKFIILDDFIFEEFEFYVEMTNGSLTQKIDTKLKNILR